MFVFLHFFDEGGKPVGKAVLAGLVGLHKAEKGFYALYKDEALREKVHKTFRFICKRTGLRYLYLYTIGEDGLRHYVICAAKSDADASDTDSKIKAELKPGGMVDSEEISYQHLHRGYRAGMTSDVMPLKLNKNGTISDNSSVYTTQEFIKLSGEVREVICSLAEEILRRVSEWNA